MSFDPQLHARRREAVASAMHQRGGGAMLLPAADEKARNGDSEYPFRQDSYFLYLIGLEEPQGCALLFAGDGNAPPRLVLFVRPRDRERETWTGVRAGVEGAVATYGAAEAFPVEELERRLPGLLDGAGVLWF